MWHQISNSHFQAKIHKDILHLHGKSNGLEEAVYVDISIGPCLTQTGAPQVVKTCSGSILL